MKKSSIHKSFGPSAASYSAHANTTQDNKTRENIRTSNETRFIQNVTEEEWDCPRPNTKTYKPKSVKENIKRNLKKMNDELKNQNKETAETTANQ